MKYFALVNSGLETVSEQEIKEKGGKKVKVFSNVVEFEGKEKPRLQSARRLLFSLGRISDVNDFEFEDVSILETLPKEFKFKVEVEGIKGQDNRIEIAKTIAGKFYKSIEDKGIIPRLELKNPELLLIVYYNEKEYFLGIDFTAAEMSSRKYRVFAHHASFKGDLAYYFVRASGFRPGEKLLVGFAKDGVIAIEAAKFAGRGGKIFAFDESQRNITAARKNAHLAGVKGLLEIQKYSLEDLDVKYYENNFDHIILHVTTKDEDKINEIYYQVSYILKQGGLLVIISRKKWDMPISDKFTLQEEKDVPWGESGYKLRLLSKR